MAVSLQTHYPLLSLHSLRYSPLFRNPNPNPYNSSRTILFTLPNSPLRLSGDRNLTPPTAASRRERSETTPPRLPQALVRLAVSAALFLCLGTRVCSASSPPLTAAVQQEQTIQGGFQHRKKHNHLKELHFLNV